MSQSEEPGRTPPYIADMVDNPPTTPTPSPPESPSGSLDKQMTSPSVGDNAYADLEKKSSVPKKKVEPEEDDDDPWKMTKEEYEGIKKELPLPQVSVVLHPRPVLNPSNKGTGTSAPIQRKRPQPILWTTSTAERVPISDEEAEKLKRRRLRFGGDLDPPTNDGKLLTSTTDGSASLDLDEVIMNRNITFNKKKYNKSKEEGELEEEMEPLEDYGWS